MVIFPSQAILVLELLYELGGARSQELLVQFISGPPEAASEVLAALVAEGRVLEVGSGSNLRYSISGEYNPSQVTFVLSGREGANLPYCFALRRSGHILDACAILFEHIDRLLDASLSHAALACLELAARYLGEWSAEGQNEAERRRYMEQFFSAADTAMYLSKQLEEVLTLTQQTRTISRELGDQRAETLLDLVEACLINMHSKRPADTIRSLRKHCLQAIAELDDPDIMTRCQYFLGMFSLWEGDFHQVLVSCETACHQPQLWRGRFQTEMYPLYTSSAALYLGRFHQAVGILEAARRAAELEQNRYKTLWWEAQLAMVLLYMNRCDEALELIDHVNAEANAESETKILLWGMRGLAYYHWRKGKPRAAHKLLTEAMSMARSNNLMRPVYSYPWLYDMLLEFDRLGLPPVPGMRLEFELESSLRGINRHLRASALRTVAGVRCGGGASLEETLEALRESETLFEAVGNPLETARTRLRMADCLFLLGQKSAAQGLYADAVQVLGSYEQPEGATPPSFPPASRAALFWAHAAFSIDRPDARVRSLGGADPEGVSTALHSVSQNATLGPQRYGEGTRSRRVDFRTLFSALAPWEDLQQFLAQFVHIACSELGAERAVLFRKESNGYLTPAATSNITDAELNTGVVAARLARIQVSIGGAPLLLEEKDAVSLTLPLQAGTSEQWLLYLESAYAVRALLGIDPHMQKEAVEELSNELYAAFRYQNWVSTPKAVGEEEAPYQRNTEVLLHDSPAMRQVVSKSRQVAVTNAPVIILGETGAGKELLAEYIHRCSGRSGAFVPVHPASIAENLFESEFFGHEKGAFTGAHKRKIGLVELAHNGTLFIDEVGDIPAATQTKFLRVFQNQRFLRVGGNVEMQSDFRLIGATNKDLWQEVLAGRFREDLYYRMSVVPLHLPPLRERKEDIPLLVQYFLDTFARRYHRSLPPPREEELAALVNYPWPGNVRELKSVVERAVILHQGGRMEYGLALPREQERTARNMPQSGWEEMFSDLPTLAELQNRYIRHVLALTNGKISGQHGALRVLGMKRSTFYAKVKSNCIDIP